MSEPRRVTEAAVLAAVAHPLRRRLLDVLRVHGPQTASLLAQRTGSAVGNISHHVRVLADNGLLEVAPELARDRRERWWRLLQAGLTWNETDFDDDPAAAATASAAASLGLQRQVELTRAWFATASEQPDWRDASLASDYWMRLSVDELATLAQEVGEVLGRWRERGAADDGVARRPVFVFARGFPASP